MSRPVVLITGSSGLLGSAITVDLAKDYRVVGIDKRYPSEALKTAASDVRWECLDIGDEEPLAKIFHDVKNQHERVDAVIHFAAFYHFGKDRPPDYEHTNIKGTQNVIDAAREVDCKQIVFASSLAGVLPAKEGEFITETTPADCPLPYGASKADGEKLLSAAADSMQVTAVRICGIFTDWCELPPLHGLVKHWSGSDLKSRMIPGKGKTGIPYLHRDDLAKFVRAVLGKREHLKPFEILLPGPKGATTHAELFPHINPLGKPPRFVPPFLVRNFLRMQCAVGAITGNMPYERPWMIDYVDRPLAIDNSYSQKKLEWQPDPNLLIFKKIPIIMERFKSAPEKWEQRNRKRNNAEYEYVEE